MIIKGNKFTDERGVVRFVNDFDLPKVKRFYTITHADTNIIRAWQGHKLETKHFFVSKGSFLFAWVKIDDWENPSSDLTVNKAIITADEPTVLTVLAGHANGFKALEDDSTVVVFSNLSQQESSADMYRFEKKTWSLQ